MTKVTIILFYIRLCHVYTRFCQICWLCIILISLYTIILMCLNIFQCTPIRWNWDRFGGEDVDFWCMDLNKLTWSNNITNIIFDIVVLVLPIPLVWRSKSLQFCRVAREGRKILTLPQLDRHYAEKSPLSSCSASESSF